jgi:hypothetical protein
MAQDTALFFAVNNPAFFTQILRSGDSFMNFDEHSYPAKYCRQKITGCLEQTTSLFANVVVVRKASKGL